MYILYKHLLEVAMARLTRWGNSDGGLRIPKSILEAAGLRVGDEIGCRLLDSGSILLTPLQGLIAISEGESITPKAKKPDLKW
jgi:antitoxin component of MazEF toxin-antitoxin module